MKLIHTANAGFILETRLGRIGVDALHSEIAPPYATISRDRLQYLLENIPIDVFLYTHNHPDHFSAEWTLAYMKAYGSRVIMPAHPLASIPLTQEEGSIVCGDYTVEYHRLLHSGAQFEGIPNYGYRIHADGKTLLVIGDAGLEAPGLLKFCTEQSVDAAIFNFPFAALSHGISVLRQIPAKEIYIHHMPDDPYGKLHYAEAVQKRMPLVPACRGILCNWLQSIEI